MERRRKPVDIESSFQIREWRKVAVQEKGNQKHWERFPSSTQLMILVKVLKDERVSSASERSGADFYYTPTST